MDELKNALEEAAKEVDRLTLRNQQLSEFQHLYEEQSERHSFVESQFKTTQMDQDDRIGKLIKAEENLQALLKSKNEEIDTWKDRFEAQRTRNEDQLA